MSDHAALTALRDTLVAMADEWIDATLATDEVATDTRDFALWLALEHASELRTALTGDTPEQRP